MGLTDSQVRNAKPQQKPFKKSDGGGLYLHVTPTGSKLWRMAYRFAGKQRTLAFGKYPAVSLSDARAKRDDAKRLIASGSDPSHKVKAEKAARKTSSERTFDAIASEFLSKLEIEGRASATLAKKRWLIGLASPAFGNRPVDEITAADILVPLREVEAVGNYETARRLRSTIGQVIRYAIATARADNDPTFGLRGALIAPKVTHRAAIVDADEFSELVRVVWQYRGAPETCAALKLMCILYPRPGELRNARWGEIDFDNKLWIIPAERTKMRREHLKPLPALAIRVLRDIQRLTGNREFVFPSAQSPRKPMSENTLNVALRRLGYTKDQATSHGFRASASSLLNESGKWPVDAIEAELGHMSADQVRRAYNRTQYWGERVSMSNWWASKIAQFAGQPERVERPY
jgi:integrase